MLSSNNGNTDGGSIYGDYAGGTGNATDDKTIIMDSGITGDVYGNFAASGDATGSNSITSSRYGVSGNIAGNYVVGNGNAGDSTQNVITNSIDVANIYGDFAKVFNCK